MSKRTKISPQTKLSTSVFMKIANVQPALKDHGIIQNTSLLALLLKTFYHSSMYQGPQQMELTPRTQGNDQN